MSKFVFALVLVALLSTLFAGVASAHDPYGYQQNNTLYQQTPGWVRRGVDGYVSAYYSARTMYTVAKSDAQHINLQFGNAMGLTCAANPTTCQ
jgi:hypothetical protein